MPDLPAETSPIDALPRPLLVAAHDAGAANMIAAWCAEAQTLPDLVYAQGPAAAILSRVPGLAVHSSPDWTGEKAATVLTGTGWASDLEHDARLWAADNDIPSIAVIDHWVNYEARFTRGGETVLPDTMVVGDALALQIAQETFPGHPVELWPNRYFAAEVSACGPVPLQGDTLFVAEPARSDWGREQEGEFQALDWFALHGGDAARRVRLRPHPSDPAGKYDRWLGERSGWSLDASPDLSSAMKQARCVAGLNSMAMAVALEAGREVVCTIPPWGPECLLPHAGIKRLLPNTLA